MLRNKRILFIFILIVALSLIPNICKAATTYTAESKTSTGGTVKWSYELDDGGSAIKLKCTNGSSITGTVAIPSEVDGHTVVSIGSSAFYDCKGITGVTIPDTVNYIGDYAFYNCTGLTNVTLPKNLVTIGDYVFEYDVGLTSVTFNSGLISIGDSAFSCCSGLKEIAIPDTVTTIGSYAFSSCKGLSKVTLSKNLTLIDRWTFYNCISITTIEIPESVITISSDAFPCCNNLKKVKIPDSVALIEKDSFYNCSNLTIYGNDGKVSKQYAEDNKIKFDYISNWNKAEGGSDVTAPTVKSMSVDYSSVKNYYDSETNCYILSTGTKLIIKVKFSEQITGKEAPTLVIKCGAGENRTLTDGVIAGDTITYTYTIKEDDKGQVASVSFSGGDITDLVTNKAELSCKVLYVEYHDSSYAYANGDKTLVEGNGNGGDQTVKLDSISIPKTKEIVLGDTVTLNVTFEPSNATDKSVTWSSSNTSVATVDSNGKITPKKIGTTTITVTSKDGSKKATCTVTVKEKTGNGGEETPVGPLPQTGITSFLLIVLIGVIIVAVISKKKVGKYKDI